MRKQNNSKKSNSGKIVSFKKVLVYPNSGNIRFQINLDKNGQVYEVKHRILSVTLDPETKKKSVKVVLGERPRLLFERIKGRPFAIATSWIDEFIQEIKNENIEQ